MAKASDNQFPYVTFLESSAPATPSSGLGKLYEKTDGKVYFKNDGGTEYDLTSSGSSLSLSTYTPVIVGQTTTPTYIGTGSVQDGRYVDDGIYITGDLYIKARTSGFSAGSGYYAFSLPVAAHADDISQVKTAGYGRHLHNGTTTYTILPAIQDSTHVWCYLTGSTSLVGSGQPNVQVAGNEFWISFRYRKA